MISAEGLPSTTISAMIAFVDVLIPGNEKMPTPSSLPSLPALLERAAAATSHDPAALADAVALVPAEPTLADLKTFSEAHPEHFTMLVKVVSAAYYMDPQVLSQLDYPTDRRHPAGLEDFANEYESGILEPVENMKPRYRTAP